MAKVRSELLKGNTAALILTVLSEGPLHGYAIARRLEALSDNLLSLNEGSLYPTLHSLENDGAVAAAWERESGRPRKCYHITARGRKRLAELAKEWTEFSGAVNRVLGVSADGYA
jgi:PadR family transcriptional regulator, regulatory protein PadR